MTLTLVLKKGFNPRNIYVKYEKSISDHSKSMAHVNVFADKQTDKWILMQGHKKVISLPHNP